MRSTWVFPLALISIAGCVAEPEDAEVEPSVDELAEMAEGAGLSTDAKADGAPSGCFRAHLREAIAVNEERRELYAQLSNGASRAISDRLILSERGMQALALPLDTGALLFQRKGIGIMCDEFVSMELASPFRGQLPAPAAAPALLDRWSPWDESWALRQAYLRGGFEAVSRRLEDQLAKLAPHPSYLCMTRHVLESTLRAANLAPKHIAASRAAGQLFSPRALSVAFIEAHLDALFFAKDLDQRAAPLQARGIAIICDDVPPIPAH